MVSPLKPIRRPHRFAKARVIERRSAFRVIPMPEVEFEGALTDTHGLSIAVFGELSYQGRYLVAKCLDFLGMPKDRSPSGVITIPECVFFGLCLEYGLTWDGGYGNDNSFSFQSWELGGRQPGGAVVDFVIWQSGKPVAVRVQSVFHAAGSPFSSESGPMRERDQEVRLLAEGFSRVVDVNRPEDGLPLESKDGSRIYGEMERALGRRP